MTTYIEEHAVHLTLNEMRQLNRIFNILGEENLKANYFIRDDIEAIYSVIEKVREGIEEAELDGAE